MDLVIELPVSGLDPRITHVLLYRRRAGVVERVPPDPDNPTTITAGTQYVTIKEADAGDQYWVTFYDATSRIEGGPSEILVARETGLIATTVTGIVISGDGAPVGADLEVRASLWAAGLKPTTADGGHIVAAVTAKTDSTGVWSLDLVPNDLIRPLGSYWKITVFGQTYFKTINSANGPSQNFTALTDVTPFEAS